MTVYCLIERDALGHTKVLRVYTDPREAHTALDEHEADTDGRHWYRLEITSMEDAEGSFDPVRSTHEWLKTMKRGDAA